MPIFVVHGRGGYTLPNKSFMASFSDKVRLVMLELPGIKGDRQPLTRIEDVASAYVDQIQRDHPKGEICLASMCVGSTIAFEMARQLEERGRMLRPLVLIDPRFPKRVQRLEKLRLQTQRGSLGPIARLAYSARYPELLDPKSKSHKVLLPIARNVRLIRILYNDFFRANLLGKKFSKRYAGHGLKVLPRAQLMTAYRFFLPKSLDGPVHILASKDRSDFFLSSEPIWQRLVPGRKVEIVSERHNTLFHEHGPDVARRMEELLTASGVPGSKNEVA